MTLSLNDLHNALETGAAIRSRSILQPAGGPGDKLFPPTYAVDNGSKYVTENRRIDGQTVPCVLLDSVASQANRQEEALERALLDYDLPLPRIAVDFTQSEGIADLGEISYYQAPHRIADAILRDGLLGDEPFRASPIGRSFTESSPKNATAMYTACPHALVFGVWDSTGPKGGLGTKFARLVTSEVIGVQCETGRKTASRLDPLQIGSGVPLFEDSKGEWTVEATEAKTDKKGKPVRYKKDGKASEANHSNVTPSIDDLAGGVTVDRAEQTWVLSLAGIRRLRFPTRTDGTRHPDNSSRRDAEKAARTALIALALTAAACARVDGYDFRSRCVLAAEGKMKFELIDSEGGETRTFSLTAAEARTLLTDAVDAAKAAGMVWNVDPILLTPMPRLVSLIQKSRALGDEAQEDQ